MKKLYVSPELELVVILSKDVMSASSDPSMDDVFDDENGNADPAGKSLW